MTSDCCGRRGLTPSNLSVAFANIETGTPSAAAIP
jgi:hypothetical protein